MSVTLFFYSPLYFSFSPIRAVQGAGTVRGMSIWTAGAGALLYQDWCQCQYGRLCKLSVYLRGMCSLHVVAISTQLLSCIRIVTACIFLPIYKLSDGIWIKNTIMGRTMSKASSKLAQVKYFHCLWSQPSLIPRPMYESLGMRLDLNPTRQVTNFRVSIKLGFQHSWSQPKITLLSKRASLA